MQPRRAGLTPRSSLATPAEFAHGDAPEIATENVDECPSCLGREHARFAAGFDYELRTCRNEWTFVKCAGCGLVRLHPRPAVAALPVIYPPSYYAYNYAQKVNPVARWAKAFLDRRKLRSILRRCASPPASFLDAGCGDGRYLRAMSRAGLAKQNIHGLELDERVVKGLSEAGFQVSCERVETCRRIPDGSIDLATMFHVIEHVADPAAVVRQLARWLSPGGLLALETPNLDSFDARKFRESFWGGYHIPRHWTLFTPESLRRLMESAGLEVVATLFQTGHSFWMYSYHHRLRYGKRPRRWCARMFDPFGGSIVALAAFTAFDKLRAFLGGRTSAMLMLARKK
ncbi:MAG: hypothetical protein FD180_2049 [Planctomycetota bacterium]|nr:MAG: hypothetical protein FD180_2049 [Planctomycetota bacterium]